MDVGAGGGVLPVPGIQVAGQANLLDVTSPDGQSPFSLRERSLPQSHRPPLDLAIIKTGHSTQMLVIR